MVTWQQGSLHDRRSLTDRALKIHTQSVCPIHTNSVKQTAPKSPGCVCGRGEGGRGFGRVWEASVDFAGWDTSLVRYLSERNAAGVVRVCVRACVRARARVCVCVCVCVCARVCGGGEGVGGGGGLQLKMRHFLRVAVENPTGFCELQLRMQQFCTGFS